MPARSKVTDQQIYEALARTGGAVAGAARLLRVSTRTLQRRSKANPNIRLHPARDPRFETAWQRVCDAHDAAEESQMFGTTGVAWARYQEEVAWDEVDVQIEPQALDGYRLRDLMASLESTELMRVNVPRSSPKSGRR